MTDREQMERDLREWVTDNFRRNCGGYWLLRDEDWTELNKELIFLGWTRQREEPTPCCPDCGDASAHWGKRCVKSPEYSPSPSPTRTDAPCPVGHPEDSLHHSLGEPDPGPCNYCHGSGHEGQYPDGSYEDCHTCNGTGNAPDIEESPEWITHDDLPKDGVRVNDPRSTAPDARVDYDDIDDPNHAALAVTPAVALIENALELLRPHSFQPSPAPEDNIADELDAYEYPLTPKGPAEFRVRKTTLPLVEDAMADETWIERRNRDPEIKRMFDEEKAKLEADKLDALGRPHTFRQAPAPEDSPAEEWDGMTVCLCCGVDKPHRFGSDGCKDGKLVALSAKVAETEQDRDVWRHLAEQRQARITRLQHVLSVAYDREVESDDANAAEIAELTRRLKEYADESTDKHNSEAGAWAKVAELEAKLRRYRVVVEKRGEGLRTLSDCCRQTFGPNPYLAQYQLCRDFLAAFNTIDSEPNPDKEGK